MPNFSQNSPLPEFPDHSNSPVLNPDNIINILKKGSEQDFKTLVDRFYKLDPSTIGLFDQVSKRDILVELLKHGVFLSSGNGATIDRNSARQIDFSLLHLFEVDNFTSHLADSKNKFLDALRIEDDFRFKIDKTSPLLSRLSNDPQSHAEILAYSLATLSIESNNANCRAIALKVLRGVPSERNRDIFGSPEIAKRVSALSSVYLLVKIGYPTLGKSLGQRIAEDIKSNTKLYMDGRFDTGLYGVQEVLFQKLLEYVSFIRAYYSTSFRKWGNDVIDLKADGRVGLDISYPKGFLEYVFTKGAEKHVIQPALGSIIRDYHSRPLARTAYEILKSLCANSEQQARNIIGMDWPSIYGHAQLDYDFERTGP
jgi:hypothetical protein